MAKYNAAEILATLQPIEGLTHAEFSSRRAGGFTLRLQTVPVFYHLWERPTCSPEYSVLPPEGRVYRMGPVHFELVYAPEDQDYYGFPTEHFTIRAPEVRAYAKERPQFRPYYTQLPHARLNEYCLADFSPALQKATQHQNWRLWVETALLFITQPPNGYEAYLQGQYGYYVSRETYDPSSGFPYVDSLDDVPEEALYTPLHYPEGWRCPRQFSPRTLGEYQAQRAAEEAALSTEEVTC